MQGILVRFVYLGTCCDEAQQSKGGSVYSLGLAARKTTGRQTEEWMGFMWVERKMLG